MQSKKASTIETVVSVGSGYLLAVIIQLSVFPMFGLYIDLEDSYMIAAIFTAVSIVRGYIFRRLFNWLHTQGILI